MSSLAPNPRTPEQWARDASALHGWLPAYGIAKKYALPFFQNKDGGSTGKNPHAGYWQKVVTWIESNAPAGALEEPEQKEPARGSEKRSRKN